MKLIGVFTIFLLSASYVKAQLKFKAVEKSDAFGVHTVINETTGNILPENLVPKSETIVQAVDNVLFTRSADTKDPKGETLKKYELTNGRVTEVGSMPFLAYAELSFFQNGAFVLMESNEGGGMNMKLYSKELLLLSTVTPYSEGYSGFFYHNNGNSIAIGVNRYKQDASKLISFSSKGELIFEKPISVNGIVGKVLSSDNFFSVYSYNVNLRSLTLSVFDKIGTQLWSNPTDATIQKWSFVESSISTLVIGTSKLLSVYDALKGDLISQKKLSDIYDDAHIGRSRSDGAFRIIDILPLKNDQVGVLLSEPINTTDATNNLLYIFKKTFAIQDQKIKINDTKGLLRMKSSQKELLIIKDKEILKYEYAFQE